MQFLDPARLIHERITIMGTLLATYVLAGAVVSAYVALLAFGGRRLSRRLERLEKQVVRDADERVPSPRLAG